MMKDGLNIRIIWSSNSNTFDIALRDDCTYLMLYLFSDICITKIWTIFTDRKHFYNWKLSNCNWFIIELNWNVSQTSRYKMWFWTKGSKGRLRLCYIIGSWSYLRELWRRGRRRRWWTSWRRPTASWAAAASAAPTSRRAPSSTPAAWHLRLRRDDCQRWQLSTGRYESSIFGRNAEKTASVTF